MIKIWPNPADNLLSIENSKSFNGTLKYDIINHLGEMIFSNEIINAGNKNSLQLNVGDLPDGLYTIIIQDDNTYCVKKIIIN